MNLPRPQPKRAFTLTELLTVIAIVAILAAILIPTVGRVRESAHVSKTMANLRQLQVANLMHAADYKGLYVPVLALALQGNNGATPAPWYENPIFGAYLNDPKFDGWSRNQTVRTGRPTANGGLAGPSLAPSTGANNYPRNFSLRNHEVASIAPRMIMFGDASNYWISGEGTSSASNLEDWPDDTNAGPGGLAFRYRRKATVALADGSVARLTKSEATGAADLRRYFPLTGDGFTDTTLSRNPPPY